MIANIVSVLALLPTQQDDGGLLGGVFGLAAFCCWAIVLLMYLAGTWQIYSKAGRPGWAAIIPIYNIWVLQDIVGRPNWWIILYFIPFVNFIVFAINMWDLSRSFDKSIGYTIGLIFLPFIFVLVLGFGDAQYYGPAAAK